MGDVHIPSAWRAKQPNWTTCAPFLDDLLDDLSRPNGRGQEGSGFRKSHSGKDLRRARSTPLLVDGRLGRLGPCISTFFHAADHENMAWSPLDTKRTRQVY